MQQGELFLVHGGGSGIGTFAIQLAKQGGATVACTVGSRAKGDVCRNLGADLVIDYKEQDFVEEVRSFSDDGADVILDIVGAAYLGRNVEALARQGRLVVIGLQGGTKGELNLSTLMQKRAAIIATTLRHRPAEEKAAIMASVRDNVWPLVAAGSVRPLVHEVFSVDDVARAHELVDSGTQIGKVVITLSA